jgi:hypothetical protein
MRRFCLLAGLSALLCLCGLARAQNAPPAAKPVLDRFWFDFPGDGGPRIWTQINADTWEERWFGSSKQHTVVGRSEDPNRPGTVVKPGGTMHVLIPDKGSGGNVGFGGSPKQFGNVAPRQELNIDPKFIGAIKGLPPEIDIGDKRVAIAFMRSQIRGVLRRGGDPATIKGMIETARKATLWNVDPAKLPEYEKLTLAFLDDAQAGKIGNNPPVAAAPPGTRPVAANATPRAPRRWVFIIAPGAATTPEQILGMQGLVRRSIQVLPDGDSFNVIACAGGKTASFGDKLITADSKSCEAYGAQVTRLPADGKSAGLLAAIRSAIQFAPTDISLLVDLTTTVPEIKVPREIRIRVGVMNWGETQMENELMRPWGRVVSVGSVGSEPGKMHMTNRDTNAIRRAEQPAVAVAPAPRPMTIPVANAEPPKPALTTPVAPPPAVTPVAPPAPPTVPVQPPAVVTPPALTQEQIAKRNQDAQVLFDYLMKQYDGMLSKSRDRLGRSLTLVCISRIPRVDATAKLLNVLQTDRDTTVRMVAWQCLLARANGMTEMEFKQWSDLTNSLIVARGFQGTLRIPLLQMLALRPVDRVGRDFVLRTIEECNAVDPDDDAVLIEVAHTIKAWGDPAVVDAIMPKIRRYEDMERVELILHVLGCDVTWSHYRNLQLATVKMMETTPAEYEAWWRTTRPAWRAITAAKPGAWRSLRGQFVPTVEMSQSVDPEDPVWKRDLELKPPAPQPFTLGIVVDTTGSMGSAITWIRRDLKRLTDVFRLIAPDPMINSTFYRDFGDQYVVKTQPSTSNLNQLGNWFIAAEAKGGGDIPEAVREGLTDNFTKGNYPAGGRKAVVLIGDAPPHSQTQEECERIVRTVADKGVRLYAMKVHTGEESPDLSAFDKLAAAGQGRSQWFYLLHNSAMPIRAAARGIGSMPAINEVPRDTWLPKVENPSELTEAGEWLVAQVLTGVVNPQFADRVQPVAGVVWQMLKQPTTDRRIVFIPNGGDKTPRKGVQDR